MILNTTDLKKCRRNIAFDIGNVLVYIDMEVFTTQLVIERVCETLDEAEAFAWDIQGLHDVGAVDMEISLKLHFRDKLTPKKLRNLKEAWLAVVKPCPETLGVVGELIAEGCEVALLSNIGTDHAEYLSEQIPHFEYCTKHFSCYVGARKPTKLFYQSFVMDHQSFSEPVISSNGKPYRGLFLDDRIDNVFAAKKYLDSKIFDISSCDSGEVAAKEMVRLIQDI